MAATTNGISDIICQIGTNKTAAIDVLALAPALSRKSPKQQNKQRKFFVQCQMVVMERELYV